MGETRAFSFKPERERCNRARGKGQRRGLNKFESDTHGAVSRKRFGELA
jgi:hypothetical protein